MRNKSETTSGQEVSGWERIKQAFANDWEQTKADFGVAGARDMNQDVDDTLKQAAGTDDAFENREQAFRFGFEAQGRYRKEHPKWNENLDRRLREDYKGDYDADRRYIEHAYGYNYDI